MEALNDGNLAKYLKLIGDDDYPHRPDIVCFVVVDLDVERREITGLTDVDALPVGSEAKDALTTSLSLGNFFEKIGHLIRFKGS